MTQDTSTYYVWIGGSCDYGHKERAGGAAVVIELMEQREQSQTCLNSAESRQKKTKSQHNGTIIRRDVSKRIRDAALYTFVYHYTFAAKSKSLII